MFWACNMCGSALKAFVIFSGVSQLLCAVKSNKTNGVKPESLELLNVIKQDLRKDNDDYAEHQPRRGAPRNAFFNVTMKTLTINTTASYQQQKIGLEENKRRAYMPIHRGQFNPRYSMKSRHSHARRPHHQMHTNDRFKFHMKNQYPDDYVSRNAEKLKNFMESNRGLLQQNVVNTLNDMAKPKALSSEEPDRLVPKGPRAELLDMAAARGGRIHSLRIKGRLCHRNVMIPEGPKYDRHGNVYLPEHNPEKTHGRDYEHTKPPVQMLPRCCNCCRKSVLGCE